MLHAVIFNLNYLIKKERIFYKRGFKQRHQNLQRCGSLFRKWNFCFERKS